VGTVRVGAQSSREKLVVCRRLRALALRGKRGGYGDKMGMRLHLQVAERKKEIELAGGNGFAAPHGGQGVRAPAREQPGVNDTSDLLFFFYG